MSSDYLRLLFQELTPKYIWGTSEITDIITKLLVLCILIQVVNAIKVAFNALFSGHTWKNQLRNAERPYPRACLNV